MFRCPRAFSHDLREVVSSTTQSFFRYHTGIFSAQDRALPSYKYYNFTRNVRPFAALGARHLSSRRGIRQKSIYKYSQILDCHKNWQKYIYFVSLRRGDVLRGLFEVFSFSYLSPMTDSIFCPTDKTARSRMIDANIIHSIVQEYIDSLEDRGFFVVHVEVHGADEVLVEIDHDEAPIDINTIVSLTRWVEDRLNRDAEDFELTVSSAGLTSPLRMPRQYHKYIGEQMIVILRSGTKEQGILTYADDNTITLEVTRMVEPEGERRKKAVQEVLTIPYTDVKSAVYDLKV